MMEGIFICAAPHCLKSFLKKTEFESHINEIHADLLHPNKEKEGIESEAISARKPSASDSTVQAPPRQLFSPSSSSQVADREDKTQRSQSRDQPPSRPVMQPRPMPPFPAQVQNYPSEQHPDNNQPQVFDRAAPQNRFPQQTFDPQGGLRQDSVNPNAVVAPPQFGYAPYPSDGSQQFFGAPYEMARQESTPEAGSEHGSLLGFPPGPAGPMNFAQNYPRPWNMGPPGSVPLEPPMVSQGTTDGFVNIDPHGRGYFQGDYGQNAGILPSNLPPPAANKGIEQRPGGNFVDQRDSKGILAPQPLTLPPPPPLPPPHLSRGRSYSGEGNHDAPPGFGWQPERRDSFGGGQD